MRHTPANPRTDAAPTPEPVLTVAGLNVSFGGVTVVQDVSLTVSAGECLALVGESGSGKSVTARSLLGMAGPNARVQAAALSLLGHDVRSLSARQWRALRGKEVGLILQDALTSLDPLRTVGKEIDDALRLHSRDSVAQRSARVIDLLASVGLEDPVRTASQRSGELSGGMRQRALIASAIALDPRLIIADEPTTALDATIAASVMTLLGTLRQAGSGLLLISHDLATVASVADSIAVMQHGRIVEHGPRDRVLTDPQHAYTRALLAAVPSGKPRFVRLSPVSAPAVAKDLDQPAQPQPTPSNATVTSAAPEAASTNSAFTYAAPATSGRLGEVAAPGTAQSSGDGSGVVHAVLRAQGLSKSFALSRSEEFRAVSDLNFELLPGKTLGVVGESGSGKTTTARMLLGLTAPDAGVVELLGEPWSAVAESERRSRRSVLGAVYQDPLSSFDPRHSVGAILADALSFGASRKPRGQGRRITDLLDLVGLAPGLTQRLPGTLSGGQRQRLAIARALAPSPRVLICDEPVSALDVSVQAQILDLFDELQQRLLLSYVFISHDLSVIRHMSDDVLVMRAGEVVESGPTESVFSSPHHGYTRSLLAAAPPPLSNHRY